MALSTQDVKLLDNIREERHRMRISTRFDEQKCRQFIRMIYRLAGYPEPAIVLCDSPLGMQLACNRKAGFEINHFISAGFLLNVWRKIELTLNEKMSDGGQAVLARYSSSLKSGSGKTWQREAEDLIQRILKRRGLVDFTTMDLADELNRDLLAPEYQSRYVDYWFDSVQLIFVEFALRSGSCVDPVLLEFLDLSKCGLYSLVPFDNICYVSRPPIFTGCDSMGRLHSSNGTAIRFADGFGLHYIHGVYFSKSEYEWLVKTKPSPSSLVRLNNVEQRAALIEHYGYDFIIDILNPLIMNSEEHVSAITGKLVRYELLYFSIWSETEAYEKFEIPIQVLRVEDHSTHKITFLGVPSDVKTCKEARAWTFGIDFKELDDCAES